MDRETLWEQYAALPPGAQRQVEDLIASLARHYAASSAAPSRGKLSDEAVIGMWRDRQDFADSSAWVRDLRLREWKHA